MMSKHQVLISAVFVTAIVGLGCSGLGKPGGGDFGNSPNVDKTKMKLGTSAIKRSGGKSEKMPSGATMERHRKKDEYLVKLAPGVTELKVGSKVKTSDDKLDSAFGQLALKDSSKVHDHTPKKRDVADGLGLGRTIRIRTAKSPDEVMKKLEANPNVEWVEMVSEVKNTSITPDDPYYQFQWHLSNLNVTKAWEITQGEGVVVAVVDTGVSAHEDGFFKLLPGKDFVDGDNKPDDENGHGSHVAGTIGQKTGNGIGTAGVAPKVSILPVRVLDANGSGDNTGVAQGIIWAVDNGAHIINLSLGSPVNSETVADAVAYAYENDVTVIAATGNDGFTDFIGFPAAIETTIAVGSVDFRNGIAFYSNQGRQIDLVAPGGDTTADLNGDGQQDGVLQETRLGGATAYHFLQGTSMATPHVAGVAALVYANGIHDPDQIREVLISSARDLGSAGWDSTFGAGLVDPVAALGAKKPPRNSGGGGGGGEGGGKLTISKTRVKSTGESRAVIGWLTNEPARTMVRGENGFERKDANLTKVHQVAVQGRPGQTVKFTIASSTKGDEKARDEVEVTF